MIITAIIIGIALSMDTFSLAILYGTLNFTLKRVLQISISVGVFHFLMPIIGDSIGHLIVNIIKIPPSILAGTIFILLSLQMFLSVFKKEEITKIDNWWTIILFSFTVSIDSFTIGIGLNQDMTIIYPIIFMIISSVFTYVGLKLGCKLNQSFGKYSIILGSILLFLIGLYCLLV